MAVAATNSQKAFAGGLSDPVHDSQKGFRLLMDGTARPGSIQRVEDLAVPPAPMSGATGLVVLTLFDQDTPYWLDETFSQNPEIARWIGFHTGALLAGSEAEASFALFSSPVRIGRIEAFNKGTQEYPDRSVTAIVQVEEFVDQVDWYLSGPGIKHRTMFRPSGLDTAFIELADRNRAQFPRGVDFIFTSLTELACLPRSTVVTSRGD